MFENNNLKGLLNQISSGAMDKVQSALNDPNSRAEIDEQMFQSALQGIRDFDRKQHSTLLPKAICY